MSKSKQSRGISVTLDAAQSSDLGVIFYVLAYQNKTLMELLQSISQDANLFPHNGGYHKLRAEGVPREEFYSWIDLVIETFPKYNKILLELQRELKSYFGSNIWYGSFRIRPDNQMIKVHF